MTPPVSWETLLRTPHPRDHVVQLYTDEAFLGRATAQFLGAGLTNAEGAIVIATPPHARVITTHLAGVGVDVAAATSRGQLVVRDAATCLDAFMRDGRPDRAAFFGLVTPTLDGVRAAGYANVRLFGEMVDLLWDHNLEATVELEELWNEVLADQGVSLLCSYCVDPFDRHAHRGMLHRVTRCHSHLVPVENYARLDRAVENALGETFGPGAGELGSLITAKFESDTRMPSAEATLFAVSRLSRSIGDTLLDRTRAHYS